MSLPCFKPSKDPTIPLQLKPQILTTPLQRPVSTVACFISFQCSQLNSLGPPKFFPAMRHGHMCVLGLVSKQKLLLRQVTRAPSLKASASPAPHIPLPITPSHPLTLLSSMTLLLSKIPLFILVVFCLYSSPELVDSVHFKGK